MAILFFLGQARGGSSVGYGALELTLRASGPLLIDVARIRADARSKADLAKHLRSLKPALSEAVASSRTVLIGPVRDSIDFANATLLTEEQPLDSCRTVVQVRDPVDALVSWFFARKLHDLRPIVLPLEHYVSSQARNYLKRISYLLEVQSGRPCFVTHYEKLWAWPDDWISEVVRYCAVEVSEGDIATGAALLSTRTTFPRIGSHQRDGSPGNGRIYLSPKALESVDGVFAEFMETFRYPIDVSALTDSAASFQLGLSRLRRNIQILMEQNGLRMAEIAVLHEHVRALNERLTEAEAAASGAERTTSSLARHQ